MNNPTVDILIPTYNRDFLIKNVIKNVLKQTYDNYNIIISDNCSSDNTEEKVKELISNYNNVYYFKNSSNLGVYGNYNKALSCYCKGNYVLIISDDDFFTDNEYIKKAVNLIKERELDWLGSGFLILNTKNNMIKENSREEDFFGSGLDFLKVHKWGFDYFAWFTVIFNREKLLKVGEFSNALYNSDFELLFKMGLSGRCGIINSISGVYTINPFQINSNLTENYMFNGYKLYESLLENENYTELYLYKNVKDYITACFRYFMDRDALDGRVFNDKYWFNYFKKMKNGVYFPFLDESTEVKYTLYKKSKKRFKQMRESTFTNSWEEVKDLEILEYLKNFNDK